HNRIHDGGRSYRVIVYFTPARQTERIRHGKLLMLDSSMSEVSAIIARMQGKPTSQPAPRSGPLQDYVQISPVGERFARRLDVPNDPVLPFRAPIGFSDDELIRIVEHVRRGLCTRNPTNTIPLPSQFLPDLPMLSIERDGNQIRIRTGSQEGPLSGSGELLICEPDGDSFRTISIGHWVS